MLIAPLRREFDAVKARVAALLLEGKKVTAKTRPEKSPHKIFQALLDRIADVRVLDPACGSGNFLYTALWCLKDLEREVIDWGSRTLVVTRPFPRVGPQALAGIEINVYAAELARVTIWIGQIQWMIENGFSYERNPILQPLNNIECRDAILDQRALGLPSEPRWPDADIIVGNPPFLGGKMLRTVLGDSYVNDLFRVYDGRVPREADLVTYEARFGDSPNFPTFLGSFLTREGRSWPHHRVAARRVGTCGNARPGGTLSQSPRTRRAGDANGIADSPKRRCGRGAIRFLAVGFEAEKVEKWG